MIVDLYVNPIDGDWKSYGSRGAGKNRGEKSDGGRAGEKFLPKSVFIYL